MAPWLQIGVGLAVAVIATLLLLFFLYASTRPGPLQETLPPDSGQAGIQPSPPASVSLFLQPCKALPCADGLTCDSSSGICLLPDGATCDNYAQCLTGSHCSGVCVSGPTGGALAYCPCDPGFVCQPLSQHGPTLVCRGLAETPCSANSQCAGGVCNLGLGICSGGFPLGLPCQAGPQCGSGNCQLGVCQPSGLTGGQPGTICGWNKSCGEGLSCIGGTCQAGSSALGAACSPGGPYCSLPLLCQALNVPGAPVPLSQCLFPSPDPLSCTQSGACLPGFACSFGQCQPVRGTACVSSCQGSCSRASGGAFSLLGANSVLEGPKYAFQAPSGTGRVKKIALITNGVDFSQSSAQNPLDFTVYLLAEEPNGGVYAASGTLQGAGPIPPLSWRLLVPTRQETGSGSFLLLDFGGLTSSTFGSENLAVSYLQTSSGQRNIVLYSVLYQSGNFSSLPIQSYSQAPNFPGTQFVSGPGGGAQPLNFSSFSFSGGGEIVLQAGSSVYVPGAGGSGLFQRSNLPPVRSFSFYQGQSGQSNQSGQNYAYVTEAGGQLVVQGQLATSATPLTGVTEFVVGPVSGGAGVLAAIAECCVSGENQPETPAVAGRGQGRILNLNGFPVGVQAGEGVKLAAGSNAVLIYSPGLCV